MLLKDLVILPSDNTWVLILEKEGNFIKEYSVPGYTFEITVRTYYEYSYFTIKLLDDFLCVNNVAKLRSNLAYAPILTLDNRQHVFYLDTPDLSIDKVHYSQFGDLVNLYYSTEPYYDKYYLKRLHTDNQNDF